MYKFVPSLCLRPFHPSPHAGPLHHLLYIQLRGLPSISTGSDRCAARSSTHPPRGTMSSWLQARASHARARCYRRKRIYDLMQLPPGSAALGSRRTLGSACASSETETARILIMTQRNWIDIYASSDHPAISAPPLERFAPARFGARVISWREGMRRVRVRNPDGAP
ncbi:hypothetical protein B0H13DRAFT_122685 [Mycena leptocephala]|nr:hypothetical protein B0H13DRAFT_122685 [Mycena leptocephala]